jgi:hypothetical protein
MTNRIKARRIDWTSLTAAEQVAVLHRPAQDNPGELLQKTQAIIDEVRAGGDVRCWP